MTFRLILRAEWGARAPKTAPKPLTSFDAGWFVHWLGVAARAGLSDTQVLRDTQAYHQDTKGWNDIAYSFAIGREHPDTVYQLRGYGIQGGHTEGYNSQSMAVVFLLGEGEKPTPTMLHTCRQFLSAAPSPYSIARGAKVRPHNAVRSTACPGPELTAWVRTGLPTTTGDTVPTPPASTNPYAAETAEALTLLAQHAGYVGDFGWFGPKALQALHRLKNSGHDARIELSVVKAERDEAVAKREAAEAEAAQLRQQLQQGGRLPALLVAIDMASTDIGRAWDDLNEAVAKARA